MAQWIPLPETEGDFFIKGDSVSYHYANPRYVTLKGNAYLENKSAGYRLKASVITYYIDRGEAILQSNVVIESLDGKYRIFGKRAFYNKNRAWAKIEGKPVLHIVPEKIKIYADSMEEWFDKSLAIARGKVKIKGEKGHGVCSEIRYFLRQKKIVLEGNPVFRDNDNNLYKSERIEIYIDKKEIILFRKVFLTFNIKELRKQ